MTRDPSTPGVQRTPIAPSDATVTATILSFNSWETLRSAINAVVGQDRRPDRIVVIDNASSDGTMAELAALSDVEVISLPQNLGVGAGHNQGIDLALDDPGCTHVWLLEHDSIPAPDTLAKLLSIERELVLAGHAVGALLPWGAPTAEDASERKPDDRLPTTSGVNFNFNGPLISREVLEAVGHARTDFFVGLEDTEYAERMRARGLGIWVAPSTLLLHRTIGERRKGVLPTVIRSYYSTRNSLFLDLTIRRRRMSLALYVGRGFAGVIRTLLFEPQKVARMAARIVATFDGMTGRMGRRSYWFFDTA